VQVTGVSLQRRHASERARVSARQGKPCYMCVWYFLQMTTAASCQLIEQWRIPEMARPMRQLCIQVMLMLLVSGQDKKGDTRGEDRGQNVRAV
jgi:hypothetical protein